MTPEIQIVFGLIRKSPIMEIIRKMIKAGDITDPGEKISSSDYPTEKWLPAIVPGTVLNSLVYNQKYPEPYYGVNNKLESKLIPDLSGRT